MRHVLQICTFLIGAAAPLLAQESDWTRVPEILARVKAPTFAPRTFQITKFGAVADGTTDCTAAIARAIAACVQAGGGRVEVSAGEYLTGPIHLESGVNLHLQEGAVLKFKTDPKAYLPAVRTWFEGMECFNYSPLVYAYEAEDIAITGSGMLDGQAAKTNWFAWKGIGKFGGKAGMPNQAPARSRLLKMVEAGIPVEQRIFGEGDYLRPSFIETFRCRNVLIEGIRIRRSPMWVIHPVLCSNVTVRGVEIVSHGPNNDGCDPEGCSDVLVEKCLFDTGDDCIAIKSGRNADGRRLAVPSENIVVRDCTMRAGHGGVVIGSEISGNCRNVFVEDCEMSSPHLPCVLRLKSNAIRGGLLENIFVRNIRAGRLSDSVLQIDFRYEQTGKGAFNPVAWNILMENLQVESVPRVLNVRGYEGASISGRANPE